MVHFFQRFLKGHTGMSLIEVTVGGAIIAGVGLAGAQLFQDQRVAQKRIENDQSLVNFHQQLARKLDNAHHCNAMLKDFYGVTIGDITNIYLCDDSTPANCDPTQLQGQANIVPRTASPVYTEGSWTDNKRIWRIGTITIPTTTSTGLIQMKIRYDSNPQLPKVRSLVKEILLNVRFGGGQFRECFNGQESAVNNLQNDLCESLHYNTTDSLGQTARWNPVTQTCDMVGGRDCTAGNIGVAGITSDGHIKCGPLTQNYPTNELLPADATTSPVAGCGAGETLKLAIGVGNRLEVRCN